MFSGEGIASFVSCVGREYIFPFQQKRKRQNYRCDRCSRRQGWGWGAATAAAERAAAAGALIDLAGKVE